MKHCKKCGIDKEDTEFGSQKSKPRGLASTCRECSNKQKREYYYRLRSEIAQKTRVRYHRKKFTDSLTRSEPLPNISRGFLYVIAHECAILGNPNLWFAKIGITKCFDITNRFAQLQSSCPFELHVVAVKEFQRINEVEKFFHDGLHREHYRLRGEWFAFGVSELETLRKVVNNADSNASFLKLKQYRILL